ncbi:putative phosphodiesterase [Mesonia hippocampi]|uniref:Putative phosphodiesterase n=1 Tax=Mesonia hippocampi TaxID=1628250 RepID=A0A840EK10_9FLAO|nr:calcineurin-like phosphoesterase C-terminal domain-containing protein [Mesonia hippocampi]MBB4118488.1 putative phosphodiesterase [Mesonia hippocampi]
MNKVFLYFILGLVSISNWAAVNTTTIKGVVYIDENLNGTFDKREKKLKDVYVSNGVEIVKTNPKGEYQLQNTTSQTIFVITPTGFTASIPNQWYKTIDQNSNEINFGLTKVKSTKKFKIMAVGDVQVGNNNEVKYAGNTLGTHLINTKDYDFSIFLGDLVNDQVDLFSPLKQVVDFSSFPYKMVYGNHDRNFKNTQESQEESFEKIFGPTTYAFFHKGVLFISLNTIKPKGKYGYEGVYEKEEITFVDNVLKLIDDNQLIVISQHIPLVGIKNKEDLLVSLNIKNNILILSGHTHSISRRFYKRKKGYSDIQELTAGAVSGNWWTGQKDWTGIPSALMKCGSPRGYFEVTFTKNKYHFNFKSLGFNPETQVSLWFGDLNQDELPFTVDAKNNKLLVNYFSGSDKTVVKAFINGKYYSNLKKEKQVDPYVARIKRWQSEKVSPDKLSKGSPYLNTRSNHIWQLDLPTEKLKETNRIRLEITDPYLEDFEKEFIFWKE